MSLAMAMVTQSVAINTTITIIMIMTLPDELLSPLHALWMGEVHEAVAEEGKAVGARQG